MPQKTKTQLRDELEQAKKELVEVQAKTRAEMAAAKETERKLQESERQLMQAGDGGAASTCHRFRKGTE